MQCWSLSALPNEPRCPIQKIRHSELVGTRLQETLASVQFLELRRNLQDLKEPPAPDWIAMTNWLYSIYRLIPVIRRVVHTTGSGALRVAHIAIVSK
jgi:hypothetical protein